MCSYVILNVAPLRKDLSQKVQGNESCSREINFVLSITIVACRVHTFISRYIWNFKFHLGQKLKRILRNHFLSLLVDRLLHLLPQITFSVHQKFPFMNTRIYCHRRLSPYSCQSKSKHHEKITNSSALSLFTSIISSLKSRITISVPIWEFMVLLGAINSHEILNV